jgi:hypothetical protein
MAFATFEDVKAEVGGRSHSVALGIEEDGLTVGGYGKLLWAGSEVSAVATAGGCVIRLRPSNGSVSSFFVPSDAFGGPLAVKLFTNWIERGAAHSGAVVEAAAKSA